MQWITQLVSVILIHWIAIYPVDSAIQLLNNQGMIFEGKGWVISDKNYGRGTKTISSCEVISPMLSPKKQEKLIT